MREALACRQLVDSEVVRQLREDYLPTLLAPADGMWEGAIIAHAVFWEIHDGDRRVGYFCRDAEGTLLRFALAAGYLTRAMAIFRWVVAYQSIRQAIVGTNEPQYLSLCLDLQRSVAVHSYLFRDGARVAPSPEREATSFRQAERRDFDDFVRFYRTNIDGGGAGTAAFLDEILSRQELCGLYERDILVAAGECIPSRSQPPYADLGMIVARERRGRGLGRAVLMRLKERCYAAGWRPICSCAADNVASRKAIEGAGFIGEHRMVRVLL